MTINIAVLGSCVTRDNFNSRFNENYKDFYNCVLTQNQSSIISLMSKPIVNFNIDTDELSDFDKWNVRTELTKEFLPSLKKLNPDYLIIDFFGDIHFGCLELGENEYITDNRWKIWKTSFYRELKQNNKFRKISLELNTQEYLEKWRSSIDQLFLFLRREVPDCKVILNMARNTDYYFKKGNDNNSVQKLSSSGLVQKVDVNKLNEFWNTLDNYVLNNYDVESINLSDHRYISYDSHPWGPFYVHFTPDYYRDFLVELHKIVLNDYLEDTYKEIDQVHYKIFDDFKEHLNELVEKNEKLNTNLKNMHQKNIKLMNENIELINKNNSLLKEIKHLKNETFFRFLLRKLKNIKAS